MQNENLLKRFDDLVEGDEIILTKDLEVLLDRSGYIIPAGTSGKVVLHTRFSEFESEESIFIRFNLDEKKFAGYWEDINSEPSWLSSVIWWKSSPDEPWNGEESVNQIPEFKHTLISKNLQVCRSCYESFPKDGKPGNAVWNHKCSRRDSAHLNWEESGYPDGGKS